jgi:hypothetical protein
MLKRKFWHPLVAALTLVAFLSQGTWVLAGTTGGLNGTVLDENSAPIQNALVTVASPSQVVHTNTDTNGKFSFLSLIPDTYTVSVEKTGYEAVSQTGVTVVADQNGTLNVATRRVIKQIARVTSRAPSSLIKPGTVTDVYSISATQQDKIAAVGGGGNLNSAWSAIASVPGVFVLPNQAGYIGAGPSISIRGGDYDQIGYEIDGVPVNRAFDNYPSGPASSLGQQELQVYTGVPPANAEANGLSGFINQVIRTGTYPGFANIDLSIGGPAYYHKASFEVGGSSPNRNFSYYIGIGGYNQDFRYGDQFNGAQYSSTYGAPLSFCDPSMSASFAPSCYTGGAYNGNTAQFRLSNAGAFSGGGNGQGSFLLAPYQLGSLATVVDRDNVVNLHFGLPHKDGTKDDIQVLGMVNYIQNSFYSSTNDQGGATFLNNSTLGAPFIFDGFQFNGATGQTLPANYQSMTGQYIMPNVPAHPFSSSLTGFAAPVPANSRDGFLNDQAIYKVQYTHNMGSNALFKVYGYSYYSDWLNTGPQALYADFIGCCPADYELSSHSRGLSGSFIDQITPNNLINFTGSWTNSTTTRDNNTEMVNGAYGANSVNSRTQFAVLVDPTNPTNGLCYTTAAVATTCSLSGPAKFATLRQAYAGTIAPAPALNCGGGPCTYYVVENGNYATYNQVKPTFISGSLTDEWHPSSKLTINAGLRFDDFQYTGSSTAGTGARTLFYNAFNMDTCFNNSGSAVTVNGVRIAPYGITDKIANLGLASVGTACPGGLQAMNAQNPAGQLTSTFPEWQPRLGFTYSLDPQTVLRASYGRYAQGPNSAFVQYNALQQDAPYLLYNTYSFQQFGFTAPEHPITPSVSNNYDFSFEHQFKGDTSVKVTPFLRKTQGQIQQFYLNQATSFVSGLNVGKQTSQGLEFELDKGNFAAQGLSARLSFTYTNSYINYTPLPNGSSVITPLNAQIATYNGYTKACATGGSLAGSASCGSTVSGAVAAPCYTTGGAADNACAAGSIANPYWNAPAQGLLPINGNFQTFDLLPQGFGSAVDAYGAPYVASLVLNERVGKWSIAPIVQMFAGQRYGAPASTVGIAPDTCGAGLAGSTVGDPRYSTAGLGYQNGVGGSPFNAYNCGSIGPGGIPNPYTGAFDGIGAFVAPMQLQMHMQISYELSPKVTLVANLTNLVNSCFGGTKVAWAVTKACGYGVVGGGTTGDVGNTYNPGAVIQPYVNTPYEPTFPGLPFSIYVNAKIKI